MPDNASNNSVHVMIVEDERIVALHLRQQLQRLGYGQTSVHSMGKKALAAIAENPPDVILMDIHIDGEIDGIETAASIPQHHIIPVIFLSAYSEDQTLERARKTGPFGFLIKPFTERELHATIQMALERRTLVSELQRNKERLSLALGAADMGCWEVDLATREVVSIGLDRLMGPLRGENVTTSWDAFLARIVPEDQEETASAFEQSVQNGCPFEAGFRSVSDGHTRWYQAHGKVFDGTPNARLLGIIQDVTDQRRNDEKLRQASAVYETMREGILILDDDLKVTSVNQAYCDITGYDQDAVLNRRPHMISADDHSPAFFDELHATLRCHREWRCSLETRRADGQAISITAQIIAVKGQDEKISHYVAIISDHTAIRKAEEELLHRAQYDGLTTLPNRVLANEHLGRSIERGPVGGHKVACLFIDLDEFKNINDSLGHAIGDQVLLVAARRLKAEISGNELVARLGGDEFLVIAEDIPDKAAAAHLAETLIAALQIPFTVAGKELSISASIGISLFPDNGTTAQDLVRMADTAMYAAKNTGRRTHAFYKPEMLDDVAHYLTRNVELRRGLENGELVLYYQPQVSLATGEMVAVEALIRWNHPTEGLLGPGEIIPVAEQSGLIIEIGNWVLNEACRQAKAWYSAGMKDFRVAINASARQLRTDGFVAAVSAALRETGLPPHCLEIEITESMIQDDPRTITLLGALKELGVSLAIDDFGTGYSCLGSINRLPIERIKIDQAFIRGLPEDENNAALTEAIIAMALKLGLSVTAEGVETIEQQDFLMAQGCQKIQGFLFSRPVPPDEIAALGQAAAMTQNRQ